jgi:hypothetical protein
MGLKQHHGNAARFELALQPGRPAGGLVADQMQSREERLEARKIALESVGTVVSSTIAPSRLLTTRIAVVVAEVSSAASSFIGGRPLRRIRIEPPS